MDNCLQCGQRIPLWARLRGEHRFCSREHRDEFQVAVEQMPDTFDPLAVPEPGSAWAVEEAVVPSAADTELAGLQPLVCPPLRTPLGARHLPLIRTSWKYRIAYPEEISLFHPEWRMAPLLPEPGVTEPVMGRPSLGREALEWPRQSALSRFSIVLSLWRLDSRLKPEGDWVRDAAIELRRRASDEPAVMDLLRMPQWVGSRSLKPGGHSGDMAKANPVLLSRYRGLRGFPVPQVGPRDPGMAGFRPLSRICPPVTQQHDTHVSALAAVDVPLPRALPRHNVSLATAIEDSCLMLNGPGAVPGARTWIRPKLALESTASLPAPPRAEATIRNPWLPDRNYAPLEESWTQVADQLWDQVGERELRTLRPSPSIQSELAQAAIERLELYGPEREFVPPGGAGTEPLHDREAHLRERAVSPGVHVPQPMLRPLRPRVILSDVPGQGADSRRDTGVISISSLRAAGGFRR